MQSQNIKALELNELKHLHQAYIRRDFPLAEMRPWPAVRKAWKRGNYSAYVSYADSSLLAYACFYYTDKSPYALLDYLAVVPELRGRGIGSAFLSELIPSLTDHSCIFIEAEDPASAKDDAEREIREKRLRFYRKTDFMIRCANFTANSTESSTTPCAGPISIQTGNSRLRSKVNNERNYEFFTFYIKENQYIYNSVTPVSLPYYGLRKYN